MTRKGLVLVLQFLLPGEFWNAVELLRDHLYEDTEKDFLATLPHGPFVHIHEAVKVVDEYLVRTRRPRREYPIF